MSKEDNREVYNIGEKYGEEFDLKVPAEMRKAMKEYKPYYKVRNPLDSKTVPYSVMDDKNIGKR